MDDQDRNARNFKYREGSYDSNVEYVMRECGVLADTLAVICPQSRELSLALTNLEQVAMWASAAITRNTNAD